MQNKTTTEMRGRADNATSAEPISMSRRRLFVPIKQTSLDPEGQASTDQITEAKMISPPWAINLSACSQCGDCVSACPEKILNFDLSIEQPVVDFNQGECSFCQQCAAACPEPVFILTDERSTNNAWDLQVKVTDGCLLTKRIYCRSCGDNCPERAIHYTTGFHNKSTLTIDPEACTGCGACIGSCPTESLQIFAKQQSDETLFVPIESTFPSNVL